MLVGAAIARNRDGALFGGVFAEVPFVDVLQSMLNKTYPLTTPEQNEFGDPARSLTDFMTALEHSPVNRVAGIGAPNIFVLARTAENDSQVLSYEPLKWIWRLRDGSPAAEGKLFAFAEGQGHFYAADADKKARSSDLAIIHTWATDLKVRQKIAAYNIKMASPTRSNRSNRNRQRTTRNRQGGGKQRSTTRQRSTRQRSTRQRNNRQRTTRH
jgi:protease II